MLAEGLDPDDPRVATAIDMVRSELSMLAVLISALTAPVSPEWRVAAANR